MARAEANPTSITRFLFQGKDRRSRLVIHFDRVLVVEDLSDSKANLRGFVGVRQAFHFDDDRRLPVVPGKIEVWITRPW